jgi:hypothetical protein
LWPARCRLCDVPNPRKSIIDYTYDFGINQEHRLTLTRSWASPIRAMSVPTKTDRPRIAAASRAYELLETNADPSHPEHTHLKDWSGDTIPTRSGR